MNADEISVVFRNWVMVTPARPRRALQQIGFRCCPRHADQTALHQLGTIPVIAEHVDFN